jgi:Arc/MetJ-type ribon-helix-helix transcriptional regulator
MRMAENKEERDYTTVSIPLSLAERIDKLVNKGSYSNRPDFVRDAIRRLLEEKGA